MADSDAKTHHLMVPDGATPCRLDRFLAENLLDLSRSRISAVIRDGGAVVDGAPVNNPARKVAPGADVILVVPEARDAIPEAQQIALTIVYEDDALIVVDKPPGLVVHPAPGNPDRTLVNALLAHCGASLSGIGGVRRPGIVHRLDKDTSGLMVAAKTDIAHRGLVTQFSVHTIERAYRAVAWGVPSPAHGVIDANIGRSPRNRKKMAVLASGGRTARTHYRVESVLGGGTASLIRCQLETGRTHQIRVHLASIGCPLIGDPVYGRRTTKHRRAAPDAATRFPRQALHAYLLGFTHPLSQVILKFESELPDDINGLLSDFGGGAMTP
jgi:23S rRNA pseudouridine1911/1915/1917 synthase